MSNARPTVMLIVEGLRPALSREEPERRYEERMPLFRDVPGLLQKYHVYDESTETWAGIHLWGSEEALERYVDSDLPRSIATAYALIAPPQVRTLRIVDVLHPPAP